MSIKKIILGILSVCCVSACFASDQQWPKPDFPKAELASKSPVIPIPNAQALSAVAESVVDSVVNIASIRVIQTQRHPFADDPFFRHFFGDRLLFEFGVPRERRTQSLGSAVVVTSNGYLLTNNHVIQGANEVKVTLSDETEIPAEVVGRDPQTDLALLWVKSSQKLKPIPMGNSDELRLAEIVLAIGSPFGLGQTVTQGIVSAKGRANVGIVDYEDFIQTDAAINPGNSGGALVNLQGELVGINTAILSRSGGSQGIGFAVPINLAKFVMGQLLENGRVERGWLGIRYQGISRDVARYLKLSKREGVIVTGIYRNSPALKMGLKAADVIVAFNQKPVRDEREMARLLADAPIGKKIEVRILREGKEIRLTGELERQPDTRRNSSNEK